MLQLEHHAAEPGLVKEPAVVFDAKDLASVYRIVFKAMNHRKKVAGMEADDLVQALVLIILTSKKCGREKLAHWGLIRRIALNYVRNEERRAHSRPKHEALPQILTARRRPDRLLVREFLEQAELFLNDSHLELLALCLKEGYRLDYKADRSAAARDMGISLDHLRHMLDKLRDRHGDLWRQYLSMF